MLEAPPGADPQHAEPDNATPQPTAALTLLAQLQHRAHPYGQGIYCSIQTAFPQLEELAPEEKTPETPGLQKGSLELVSQQKGELLLLSSSHQHKNKYKRPVLLASLENSSGANPWRPRAQPDEHLQHSSSSPKRSDLSPATYHDFSRESDLELPAEFHCEDSFA